MLKELDRLLERHSDNEAAAQLNALGYRGWLGHPFTTNRVVTLRQRAGLKSRFERLRAQGFLTAQEMARMASWWRKAAKSLASFIWALPWIAP